MIYGLFRPLRRPALNRLLWSGSGSDSGLYPDRVAPRATAFYWLELVPHRVARAAERLVKIMGCDLI